MPVPAQDGEPAYRCAAGTPLVGCCTGRGFVNGAFYEVLEVGESIRVLDRLTRETLECSAEVLAKHTCLARSVVYNRSQGLSISDQLVVLHSQCPSMMTVGRNFAISNTKALRP